jgi:hypothetical protein
MDVLTSAAEAVSEKKEVSFHLILRPPTRWPLAASFFYIHSNSLKEELILF